MIDGLKPYPEYKESGSKWIGSVPLNWTVRNLKTLITSRSERNHPDYLLLSVAREKGVFVRSLTDTNENHNVIPEDLTNYKVARAGNLVINKMKAWQGSMGIAPCDGIVSPAYFVFDFHIANPIFGQALLRSKPYVAHFGQASDGVRIGQWDLSIPRMRQIPVLMPSEEEQDAIVRFLDYENRKVKHLIRSKRRLIELLNEQKQATIHQAVTRGLDPDVKLKSSGVEWLGDVPEHWEVSRLSRLITLQRGIDITKEQQIDGPIPVVSSGGISSFHNKSTSVGPGVIVGRKGTVGAVYFIQSDYWAHDTTLFVKKFNGNHPKFIYYLLKQLNLKRFDTGSSNPTLNRNVVHPERVPFPPVEEQRTIAYFLDQQFEQIEVSISNFLLHINLLQEYRTRLISDVVTGKLDVRGVELPAMDEAESMGDIDIGEDTEMEAIIESEEVANAY